ncbi:hypothetical protein ZIOFF_067927 [Zingiber officinale]|uniref:Uncharacterized protein n=1 Tax=Zingiber officinale TaxID=94328 RepID=A0A8J5EEC2_ZINOF|nr:hypothetical protein ZIOFF_067927 [Zingiber officinale]
MGDASTDLLASIGCSILSISRGQVHGIDVRTPPRLPRYRRLLRPRARGGVPDDPLQLQKGEAAAGPPQPLLSDFFDRAVKALDLCKAASRRPIEIGLASLTAAGPSGRATPRQEGPRRPLHPPARRTGDPFPPEDGEPSGPGPPRGSCRPSGTTVTRRGGNAISATGALAVPYTLMRRFSASTRMS